MTNSEIVDLVDHVRVGYFLKHLIDRQLHSNAIDQLKWIAVFGLKWLAVFEKHEFSWKFSE